MERAAKPAKAKVEARPPVARKSQKTDGSTGQQLELRLAEALEQQAATSEILRVISSSRTDAQPVFDTIAANALRLCDARFSAVFRFDGELIHIAAFQNLTPEGTAAFLTAYPCRPSRGGTTQRAILTRSIVHMPDIRKDPEYVYQDVAQKADYRSVLSVPMLRDGKVIGTISVYRDAARPFPDAQVELLKTFADQAVIAIENVRLFTELEARNSELRVALEQQTATSELLKVIGRSAFDLRPVFETLAENAVRLCAAKRGLIFRFDGQLLRFAVGHNVSAKLREFFERNPIAPGRGSNAGRAALERRTIHNHDVLSDPEYSYGGHKVDPYRTALAVPMIRGDELLGVIVIYRHEVRPFTDNQIALIETFADQAVIAIENVRLFKELETRNRDLTEALEQQTATSEILRVISQSPTDAQPVFETIGVATLKLCRASSALVTTFDGELIHLVATANVNPEGADAVRGAFPSPPDRSTGTSRAVLTGSVVAIPDVLDDAEYAQRPAALAGGFRSVLAVPLIREGNPIGAITVGRPEPGPFPDKQIALLQTFADQAVIAIENVRLFKELEARNADLTEALEQQTATSEILRVISQSPTDVQPVFDTIVAAALRLSNASSANLLTFDGKLIHLAALVNLSAEGAEAMRRLWPRPPSRDMAAGRAVLGCSAVAIPDVLEDADFVPRATAAAGGFRSVLAVPLVREGSPIGAIVVGRPEPGPFADKQIALLQTFADQAVIAIENVRLFNETKEALERQTATAEILKVIAGSPTDVQPVFDVIVESAMRLCGARFGRVYRYDGSVIQMVAGHGLSANGLAQVQRVFPRPAADDTISGRVILTRRPFYVRDIEREETVPALSRQMIEALGTRSQVTIPMLRAGEPIGAMTMGWDEPEAFDDQQVALLQTFADQAVIAIENVRLFNETKEALEQQTATSEILRVISQSQTDVQPVFDTIAAAALRLCRANSAAVFTSDSELIRLAALVTSNPESVEAVRRAYPRPLGRDVAASRAVLTGNVAAIPDVLEDPEHGLRDTVIAAGFRSVLAVPLIRDGSAIGSISVGKPDPGLFPDEQVALLQTFADQAVIAIENVRLFDEVQARTRELSESLQQQTATADVLKVISRSAFDLQKVLDTLAESACKLCEADASVIWRPDGDVFKVAAMFGQSPAHKAAIRQLVIRPGRDTCTGRTLLEGRTVHIRDAALDPEYNVPDVLNVAGNRAMLGVPLLREGAPIGVLVLTRSVARPFTEQQIALATTFADQAVIAIENVRLFNETTEALEQQTATSEILRVISSSPTDIQPVLDTVAECAARLCGSSDVEIFRRDGDRLRLVAHHGLIPTGPVGEFTLPLVRGSVNGRATLTGQTVHIADVQTEANEFPVTSEFSRQQGSRTQLVVPMLREGVAIGTISLRRTAVGLFTERQVALLQTFADQAVIAIENVRLFTETKEALEQQTATSEILRVISQSQTDVQPVFDTIAAAALKLCRANSAVVLTFDGELLQLAALANVSPEGADAVRRRYPMPPGRKNAASRAILTRSIVAIPDVLEDPDYAIRADLLAAGFRSVLSVPLMREESPIGAITVVRPEPGPFPDKQIALLQTFADQAVIAIENVRLFKELEARTTQLTRSVGELQALGEVGQAVSSTLDLETVLKTIVSRAVQLTGLDGGSIYEYDERAEEFRLQAAENMSDDVAEDIRKAPTRKGDGALGRTAITLEPTQVPDTLDASYQSVRKELLIHAGYRALLAVPLLREDHLLGGLLVNRKTPGEFAPEIVELLKTFATQSALAIQNARLFREIAEKGRQLEAASRHKSDFLASMSHELRTPLNAILGFNEMILGQVYGEVPGDMQVPLTDIQTSGKHLLRLINNVLDLAKIEAGRMELALADYSVHDTVESVRATMRPLAVDKGLELVATVPADIPLGYGDSGRITQCLMNLAGNSLKFTKAGKVEISVEHNGGLLRYRVADTGIGIAPDKLDSVFLEFKQSDATIASEYGGTGLGLSISKKFVEMHGGRIWVESELGKGSTFVFEIPLRARDRAAA